MPAGDRVREATRVLDNLNAYEVIGLLLLALVIFGDKLPTVIADGMRMLRNLRNMARNATGDLSRELGTDISLEDLNPKAFVRKHLLSEEEEASLRKPLEGLINDVKRDVQGLSDEVKSTAASMDHRTPVQAPSVSSTPPAHRAAEDGPATASRFIDAT
jgi:sec-independent protein translocase protein TatB